AFGALALGGFAFAAIESGRAPVGAAALFALAAAALLAFVRIEAGRGAAALVPLPMFALPDFRALTPAAVVYVATSPLSGPLAERIGPRIMIAGGVAIIGSGLILIGATAAAA